MNYSLWALYILSCCSDLVAAIDQMFILCAIIALSCTSQYNIFKEYSRPNWHFYIFSPPLTSPLLFSPASSNLKPFLTGKSLFHNHVIYADRSSTLFGFEYQYRYSHPYDWLMNEYIFMTYNLPTKILSIKFLKATLPV